MIYYKLKNKNSFNLYNLSKKAIYKALYTASIYHSCKQLFIVLLWLIVFLFLIILIKIKKRKINNSKIFDIYIIKTIIDISNYNNICIDFKKFELNIYQQYYIFENIRYINIVENKIYLNNITLNKINNIILFKKFFYKIKE